MKKVREKVNILMEKPGVLRVLKVLEALAYIILFSQMVLNLGDSGEAAYQTYKDRYIAIAMVYFMLTILILQRVRLITVLNIIVVVVLCFVAKWKMEPMLEAPDVYNILKAKWTCIVLMSVSLIDMIRYKKIATWKEREPVLTVFYVIASVLAYLLGKGTCYSYMMLVPIILLFLLRIREADYQRWIFYFTVGYYVAFLYVMIKSFITVPYTGERYYGIYVNLGLFGMFMGGAFVCALWWLIMLIKRKAPLWTKIAVSVLIVFPIVCNLLNGARVSELGIIVVGVLAICIWGLGNNKKKAKKRIIILFIVAAVVAAGGFTFLYIMSTYDKETLKELVSNEIILKRLLYWNDKATKVFGMKSCYGVIKGGTLINALDHYSSGRISHWIMYLKEADFKPAKYWEIDVGTFVMAHPHNIYIYWIYGMGWLPGTVLTAWTFTYFARTIQEFKKRNDIVILVFLWMLYYIVIGINENPLWFTPEGYAILMLYYPIIVKMFKKKTKKGEADG